jgi:hypothetical protein
MRKKSGADQKDSSGGSEATEELVSSICNTTPTLARKAEQLERPGSDTVNKASD